MSEASDPRLYLPHVARNREPILTVLSRVLPPAGLVLEVASGSDEHAAYFASALPSLLWQPTDCDPQALASIGAHRAAVKARNLLAPLHLDVMLRDWPVGRADALVCINMIHIAPWAAAEGLMDGTRRLLRDRGVIYLVGIARRLSESLKCSVNRRDRLFVGIARLLEALGKMRLRLSNIGATGEYCEQRFHVFGEAVIERPHHLFAIRHYDLLQR